MCDFSLSSFICHVAQKIEVCLGLLLVSRGSLGTQKKIHMNCIGILIGTLMGGLDPFILAESESN